MPYHVSKNQDAKVIIEQDSALQSFLSQCTATDIVIVDAYDYIKRSTIVYGNLTGGQPFPTAPATQPVTNVIALSHITTNKTAL